MKDECLVSGSFDKTIKVWDLQRLACTASLTGHEGKLVGVVFHGNLIISCADDSSFKLWDPQRRVCVATCGNAGRGEKALVLEGGRIFVGCKEDRLLRVFGDPMPRLAGTPPTERTQMTTPQTSPTTSENGSSKQSSISLFRSPRLPGMFQKAKRRSDRSDSNLNDSGQVYSAAI
jgi:WD40 repeat protein